MLLNSVLKKIEPSDSLNNYVNLLSVNDGIAAGADGSFTIGFYVKGFDFYLAENKIANDTAYVNDLLLNLMDENIGLQWIYKIDDKNKKFISNYEKSSVPPENFKYIKENKIKYLKSKNIKNVNIYLFCTINGLNLRSNTGKTGLTSKFADFAGSLIKIDLKSSINSIAKLNAGCDKKVIKRKLKNVENNLGFISSNLDLNLKRMDNQELVDYFYEELERRIERLYPNKTLKERLYILAEKYPNGPYGINKNL